MFRKAFFFIILSSVFLTGIYFIFAQSEQPVPRAERRRYDYEFDRLSEEERRRLHTRGRLSEEDRSMRRARQRINDDGGVASTDYRRSARTSGNAAAASSATREQVRAEARRTLRARNPELSERELDELIEQMLDELIGQLEARIAYRTRIRLKKQLVAFLKKLVKKYRVTQTVAEDMTRERARREIEQIQREQPQVRQPNTSQRTVSRPSSSAAVRASESGGGVRMPPSTSSAAARPSEQTRRNPVPQARRRTLNSRRYVQIQNARRRAAARARRASVRRTRRTPRRRVSRAQIRPAYYVKHFIIGSDKNAMLIKKNTPKLVTVTLYTSSPKAKYVHNVFYALSLKNGKTYIIHKTPKCLVLDKRSQYQFNWNGKTAGSTKLLPNGKYKIFTVALVFDARNRQIGRVNRYWGGNTTSTRTVVARN
jgi:hypothetical protein